MTGLFISNGICLVTMLIAWVWISALSRRIDRLEILLNETVKQLLDFIKLCEREHPKNHPEAKFQTAEPATRTNHPTPSPG